MSKWLVTLLMMSKRLVTLKRNLATGDYTDCPNFLVAFYDGQVWVR